MKLKVKKSADISIKFLLMPIDLSIKDLFLSLHCLTEPLSNECA
jgi:hypothetical protein